MLEAKLLSPEYIALMVLEPTRSDEESKTACPSDTVLVPITDDPL